jgi:SAM-dependent methyltransferase
MASDEQNRRELKFVGYISRWTKLLEKCRQKRVLHLGCIGMTTELVERKCEAMLNKEVLHSNLREVAAELVGLDYDQSGVEELNRIGFTEIIWGNVYDLEGIRQLAEPFDVILCGDLVEHLSEPGRMFAQLKTLMRADSELLLSTPNSVGLPNLLRYAMGKAVDGEDHVLSFNIFTLKNLLRRYGFFIEELYSCYDAPPRDNVGRLLRTFGTPLLKLWPRFGGTLLVSARLAQPAITRAVNMPSNRRSDLLEAVSL